MDVFLSLIAACILIIAFYIYQTKKNLPPGPWGIPIFGSLLSLSRKDPHKSLAEIAWKYGPVCGLRMGSVYTVLVTDPKLVRQIFNKDEFNGRAPLYLTHGIMKGYGLIAAEGERWKDQRKFVAFSLKDFGMVKFDCPRRDRLEKMILASVNEAVQKLLMKVNEEGGIDPQHILHHSIGNLMNALVFGKVYEEDDEEWKWMQKMQDEGVKYIGVAGALNFLPFLRILPSSKKVMKLILGGQSKTHEIYREILDNHRANPIEKDSFLALYNEEMRRRAEKGEPLDFFTETQCLYLLADLFGAGVDTTLTTLRWFLLYMASYPEEQEKIYQQISTNKHVPTLAERPFVALEAAIMEVQRLRSVVPVGFPHGTTKDAKILDFDIPKGSMVIPLQWAIHLNPEYWPDPHAFKPSRFIGENSELLNPDAFLPFQYGKRMCVGIELARMILFLFSAHIIANFKVSALPGEKINLEGECGITLLPKPQLLILEPRL